MTIKERIRKRLDAGETAQQIYYSTLSPNGPTEDFVRWSYLSRIEREWKLENKVS